MEELYEIKLHDSIERMAQEAIEQKKRDLEIKRVEDVKAAAELEELTCSMLGVVASKPLTDYFMNVNGSPLALAYLQTDEARLTDSSNIFVLEYNESTLGLAFAFPNSKHLPRRVYSSDFLIALLNKNGSKKGAKTPESNSLYDLYKMRIKGLPAQVDLTSAYLAGNVAPNHYYSQHLTGPVLEDMVNRSLSAKLGREYVPLNSDLVIDGWANSKTSRRDSALLSE